MKGEVFFSDENHMINVATLYGKLFDHDEVEGLEDNTFNRETVFLLSQYLVGNAKDAFSSIRGKRFNEQHEIFKTWCLLIKCPDELSALSIAIFNYYF
ncbi:hypothetical protein [Klebsiella variicola]|uniref:hypothetical protein n=1 Tax=Klebsiella variicola TaxID=244366 RepID=UPI0013A59E28|nr:hypothetical protein [Klebsiella variicola]